MVEAMLKQLQTGLLSTPKKQPPALYMFYGMETLDFLATKLPFEDEKSDLAHEEKVELLKSKAVAVTVPGWIRVFASKHASIRRAPHKSMKCYAVTLDHAQQEAVANIEAEGQYYEKM